jgi:hypothetical protein
LWALATLGERADRGLLKAIQRRATATVGGFTPQGVATALWALAVMGEEIQVDLLELLSARILELRDELTEVDKTQIQQWLLACELGLEPGASLHSGVARVKQEIGEECCQAFCGQGTTGSELQQEVAVALRRAGLDIEEEHRDARSGYSIDVLVRRRAAAGRTAGGTMYPNRPTSRWAVEVDGPTHFLRDGRTPSGSTLLKRRQLGQLGYTVVPVPFWEWCALRGEEEKQQYLEDKLGGGAPPLAGKLVGGTEGR